MCLLLYCISHLRALSINHRKGKKVPPGARCFKDILSNASGGEKEGQKERQYSESDHMYAVLIKDTNIHLFW